MTIEPVNEIEINGVKHPCPHFEFDPNNQNVEKNAHSWWMERKCL
jgi:hypothetical protein